jgi:single-strand DNA-binding protein
VSLFGKLAEIADKYCEKGTKVYIEGELQTNKYKDKTTGEEKYSTQVVVSGFNNVFQMVSGKGKDTTTVDDAPAEVDPSVES